MPNPFLLVTVVSWAFNFIAVKETYKQMEPATVALLRYLLMWAILVLICLYKKESLKLPKEDAFRILWLGFISLGIYMVLFLEGMNGSSPTSGSILLQLSPIFVAIFAAIAGQEKWSSKAMMGVLAAFVGTALVIYGGGGEDKGNSVLGNVIVTVSAITWAYSVVMMRPLLARYSPLKLLTLSMPGAFIPMSVYGLLPSLHTNYHTVDLYGWAMFFHVAVISGVVGFICFYRGVQQVGSSGASVYQYLVPPVTILFALMFTHRPPHLLQLAGLIVVLAGVGYASRQRFLAQTQAA